MLGGEFQSCTDENGDGTIDVAGECDVDYEEIGLLSGDTSANHFNVVFLKLLSGIYRILARFKLLAGTGAGVTGEDSSACAGSFVIPGDRILTAKTFAL